MVDGVWVNRKKKKKAEKEREREKKRKKRLLVVVLVRHILKCLKKQTTHTHISLVLRVDRLGSSRFTPSLSRKLAQPSRLRGHFVQTAYCTNGCYLQAYVKC